MEAVKRKALGRGLGALIPGAVRRIEPEAQSGEGGVTEVATASIRPNRFQPRQEFADEALGDLGRSIRQHGIIQPLVVRKLDGGHELIAGERRWRAAQRAGLENVPVIIREASDREALELALIENVQRENLNPMEEAEAYRRLMTEFQLTQETVAERVGKSRSAVANTLRLLSLPDSVQGDIRAGRISGGHARAIAGATTPALQIAVARHVVEKRLNVRDTEKLVRDMNRPSADHAAVEQRLRLALGTKVRLLARSNGSGKIEIEYFSLDELQGLLDRLAPNG